MEVPLRNHLSCTTAFKNVPQSKIKPFHLIMPTRPFKWRINHLATKTCQITAGFHRRRKRRGFSSPPKFRNTPVKEFGQRTQSSIESIRRNEHMNHEEGSDGSSDTAEESTFISIYDKDGNWTLLESKACENEGDVVNGTTSNASSTSGSLFNEDISHEENGHITQVNGRAIESKDEERITKENVITNGSGKQVVNGSETSKWHENFENGSIGTDTNGSLVKLERANGHHSSIHKTNGDPKHKCTKNVSYEVLTRLAEDNFKKGNKLFHYPEIVQPDQQIELFFNKSFSNLKNEIEVVIVGAFNDWKWKSFEIKLSKSEVKRDWWSCKFHVPKEAYNIDFVFYNGKDVYDNNYEQDYCITVDSGLDELGFQNFLLEEKRIEQEEIERQKAEKKRQEEEQRREKENELAKEVDKTQAKLEVAQKRLKLQELTKNASISVDGVWYIQPREFKDNDKVRLHYNKTFGPLSSSMEIWIHVGYNNWKDGLSLVSQLVKSHERDGDWWHAEFVVPDQAIVLNWVLADGPPKQAIVYDNNHLEDFCAIVPASIPQEPYWVEEEQNIFQSLQKQRQSEENARQSKVVKTARLKAEMKERALKAFLLSRKHVVYTDPTNVQAGNPITLYYNPANTILNGKSEIWLRYSFNRWTHQPGPLPPQRMIPVGNGSHFKVLVTVPIDAYMVDFVFSSQQDGGIYDNNNCMDYHIPVHGGLEKEPPMHVVHIATEMAPIAKVGGLGDVVTSLSRAIQDMNHNVDIILPKYDCLDYNQVKDLEFRNSYSLSETEIKVWTGKVEGLSVYFLEPQNGYFWAGCIYGRGNDVERFGFFCSAALEFLLQNGFNPDIIHCHDWPTAPISWLFKEQYMKNDLNQGHVVFTIHNLEFGTNFIEKAMAYTDIATTVSPTYAREVSGNPVISPHLYKFHGILNGIDPDIWDPYHDSLIPVPYTSENVVDGKRAAKDALQQKLKLKRSDDRPLVGIVTRLTLQKGIQLIKLAIWRVLEQGGQVVLLGSAPDPNIQSEFVNLANQLHSSHQDSVRLCLTYDEPLSHLIYAGADFILVPSIFEPCGLTQLIAMRYGSIPVVRKTGGLKDTVFDVDHDRERAHKFGVEPNGFCFDNADSAGLDYGLKRALHGWYDKRDWFNRLCKCVMEQDWSWNRPALDYLEVYHVARK